MAKREKITDQDILERLEEGSLIVNPRTARVVSITASRGEREIRPDKDRRKFRFVRITRPGRGGRVALHVLVWMAVHKKPVPPGYEGYHGDFKQLGHPDGINNLDLRKLD